MARHMPVNPSHHEVLQDTMCTYALVLPLSFKSKWYFTKEEIEEHSPSRKDGIDCEYESHLRQLYCSYLQELGMELKVPQVTIATAMIFCHRFYMRQSHAKNHWPTVSNASMFLACKAEDTPRWLKDLVVVAYKLTYSWDPLAPHKITQKEVYDKQKELILLGEQLILVTIAFDLNIEHPYKPLVAALKKLEISEKDVVKVAWNFVNDWLRTTLCLQYKPHYIAAGSLYLAAKLKKIKLPSTKGQAWWMQFDVSPKQLEEVIQHMFRLIGQSTAQATPATNEAKSKVKPMSGKGKPGRSELCVSVGSTSQQESRNPTIKTARMVSEPAVVKCNQKQPSNNASDVVQSTEKCPSETCSANSVVEDCDAEQRIGESDQKYGCKIVSIKESFPKIDVAKIKEKLKRTKLERLKNKNSGDSSLEEEMSGEDWIERELEKGIESAFALF
ncbi:hypothetical protein OROHE_001276 [Orobanche hederae]